MASHGLDLGQISFDASHTPSVPEPRRQPQRGVTRGPAPAGSSTAAVGPMFALVAGQLDRPLKERSSVPTTIFSSLAHAALFGGIFLLISMSDQIALPTPQDTTYLVAMLVAAPPPPPPAAAAPPAPAAAAPPRTDSSPQMLAPPPPDLALSLVELPEETPPELNFAPPPSLSVGLGSGFGSGSEEGSGSGFGVEGGVGWGQGMSSPGLEPVRVGGNVAPPELLSRVEPVYPPDAVAGRIEGTVVVEATVDEQGHVEHVKVLRSIGPLDQAAINAVMQWRYSPLRIDEQPARFILTVNVSFRLR